MSLATFNMDHGYVEAVVRGFRSSFLSDQDYHHLSQCETLEDVKMNLAETDYGECLANDTSFSPGAMEHKATVKLMTEFKYLQAQAVEPLVTFLDFIQVEFMIENVCLLLRGSLSGRDINELIGQCHPMGMFKESTMRNIPSFDSNARGYAELYETVLVDTPVGPYFQRYLDDIQGKMAAAADMKNILEETQIEMLKNSLMKLYLEDFYGFCEAQGGDTATIMCDVLKVMSIYAISCHVTPRLIMTCHVV